jgi:spermidine dehydrogenase
MVNEKNRSQLFGPQITRRDFMGATLLGTGAALLDMPCPAAAQKLGPEWTGYGGVGDYRFSNGNTADVVNAAHRVRDGAYDKILGDVIDTGETYDVVVVGAGFSGMTAIYEFKKARPQGRCLVLDNHPIFGGEAKQNEFDVDGYRLVGPQGSNEFVIPTLESGQPDEFRRAYELWHELGLPSHFEFAKLEGSDSSIHFDKENFAAMFTDTRATIGYFFKNEMTGGKGIWLKDIWGDDLKRAPWPENLKRDLIAFRNYKWPYQRTVQGGEEWGPWLDSMTAEEFVTRVAGLKADVLRYISPSHAAGTYGAAVGSLSAYAIAGVTVAPRDPGEYFGKTMSFPGGNSALLRHFVKAVFPEAITGPRMFDAITNNPISFAALDRPDANLKMRLSATVVSVTHEGYPATADHLNVVYSREGRLYRVKAKGAALCIGSWIANRIARDVSPEYHEAMRAIPHGPVLSVNVALHNWRFLDKLGISAARWFNGFGFFANVRRPMLVGDRPTPFHPDKPTLLTFYVPFLRPELPIEAQGPAGRVELYGTSYVDFERRIIAHMQELFGPAGFNPQRDIAGIVLNRWGHALFAPPPGFYFGKDGKPSPLKVLRQRFGRITFGHSELSQWSQMWITAAAGGTRALTQLFEVL